MIKNPYPGKFIAFEGMDGCGKSTQRDHAFNYVCAGLPGHGSDRVIKVKEPNKDLPSGRLIYGLLFGRHSVKFSDMTQRERQRYYFINRMEHYERVVIPALKQGMIVLSDRSLASISLDIRTAGDLEMLLTDEETIFTMGEVEFIRPDAVIIYDLSSETAVKRLSEKDERRRDFFEQPEKLSRTRDAYLEFATTFQDFCYVVNGESGIEDVFVATREVLKQHVDLAEWH